MPEMKRYARKSTVKPSSSRIIKTTRETLQVAKNSLLSAQNCQTRLGELFEQMVNEMECLEQELERKTKQTKHLQNKADEMEVDNNIARRRAENDRSSLDLKVADLEALLKEHLNEEDMLRSEKLEEIRKKWAGLSELVNMTTCARTDGKESVKEE